MTNERLKEIKDSIDLQKEYTIYKGFDMDLLQEEIDLYEEVMRLRIESSAKETVALELQERINKAIEILKLCNSECSKETIAILLKGEV